MECYIYRKRFTKNSAKDKNHQKVRLHCHSSKYRDTAHSIYNLRFNVPNEILAVFHNASNHNYRFVIKELAKHFEGQFKFLGENTEKYKMFSVAIENMLQKMIKMAMKIL